ncbi:MAG: hypothetical protein GPJ54_13020 [Candidatus Heimdallarchaeota archaeon]|nr:hypothetical protein [Candidatus Heimdallarchaeota archaeon]
MSKYRDLILYLQSKPLASNNDLANATGLTLPTIRKYLQYLRDNQPEPVIIGTYGEVDRLKLGLEFSYYFINIEPDKTIQEKLFQIADLHPYTNYQSLCYGGTNGFLIRFLNPRGESKSIDELWSKLRSHLHITKVNKYIEGKENFSTELNFKFWKSNRWDFSVDDWLNDSDSVEFDSGYGKDTSQSILDKINMPQMITLRELSINARRKQSQIMADIQKDNLYTKNEKQFFDDKKQRNVSRYYEFIDNNQMMKSYQLRYNRKMLNIYNQICLTGKMTRKNKEIVKRAYLNKNNTLPFGSRISFNQGSYVWSLSVPHEQITEFLRIGYDLSSEFKMVILDNGLQYSRIYPIWHRNFIEDENQNAWRVDRSWMVEEPIQSVIGENN